jgi:hypothetical protein
MAAGTAAVVMVLNHHSALCAGCDGAFACMAADFKRKRRVGSGKKAVHLLTHVLDPGRLSKRTAGEIYRRRWGVELFYRTLKRTFGYVKLRSKAGRRARLELEWGLIAMMITTMIGIDALTRRRPKKSRLTRGAKNTPKTHCLKPPIVRKATPKERERARELLAGNAA